MTAVHFTEKHLILILYDELNRRISFILLSLIFIKGHIVVLFTNASTITTLSKSLLAFIEHQKLWLNGLTLPVPMFGFDMYDGLEQNGWS